MSEIPNNLNSPMNNVMEDRNSLTNSTTDDVMFHSTSQSVISNSNLPLKVKELRECLSSDIHSCDFTWSLFQSALNSYRVDTCLRPYPPMFVKNGYKEPSKMKSLSELIPDMHLLQDTIDDEVYPEIVIDLLHWVLVTQRDPYLRLLKSDSQSTSPIFNYITKEQLSISPNLIYEVVYSKHHEEQWQDRKIKKDNSIYAFHGSRLDNFYSILKFGLQQHMSTTETLFGAGIYLTSELMLSLSYASSGTAWNKSMLGSVYSVVALCEIINDPENVKCQDITNKSRCINAGSICGTVPDKYYVVLNSDLVRIRYLLVFKQSSDPVLRNENTENNLLVWIKKYKIIILLVLYMLLLLMIGFFNSQTWHRIYKVFISKYFSDEL